ncbi:hypothetical protein A2U01_0052398 [Trifolium medium]|uniref:Uncharacterized protein n=1 Tax=Trifolium medium TaxID=97028 RepID=A0A392R5Q4_9FABA|nr:hypothetical protein [Trifolium medium]
MIEVMKIKGVYATLLRCCKGTGTLIDDNVLPLCF